jgi:hypothetical protein
MDSYTVQFPLSPLNFAGSVDVLEKLTPWSGVLLESSTYSKNSPSIWNPKFHYHIHKILPREPV